MASDVAWNADTIDVSLNTLLPMATVAWYLEGGIGVTPNSNFTCKNRSANNQSLAR